MNRNKLFQFLWHRVFKNFTPRKTDKGTGILLDDYSDRFFAQVRLAETMGGFDLAIFGDSNGEELADYESMKRFPRVTLNFSIGGTRADHWRDFWRGEIGQRLRERLAGKKILINVGGNNVLQDQMHSLRLSVLALGLRFPSAYWINLPSIYASFFADLSGRPLETIEEDLRVCNEVIGEVAMGGLIDIRPFTGSDVGHPYFFVLKDLVHYSDEFDQKVRIPLILAKIYGIY